MPFGLSRSAFQTRKPPRAGRPAWKCAEEFKRWLRKLPWAACAGTGALGNPIVAAHVDHAGGKGIGSKVADRFCIPLCDACHKRQHAIGWGTFERSLSLPDAPALAGVYWTEWPGRRGWEAKLAASAEIEQMRGLA